MVDHKLHENDDKKLIRNSTAEFLIFTGQAAEHLKNIFQSSELLEDSVIRKFRNTASDGKSYLTKIGTPICTYC